MNNRQIQLSVAGTNLCVIANLLEEQNPEVCEILWNNLPYRTIQLHTVVAGKNIYNFIPDPTPFFEHTPQLSRRMACKPGTIFSPFPRSMFIKYGEDSEDHQFPPVAQVVEEDLETLNQIGKQCWEGMYRTKQAQEIMVTRVSASQEAEKTDGYLSKLISPNSFESIETQELVADINRATQKLWLQPPLELKSLIDGSHSSQTKLGSFGQYLSAIFFTCQEISRISTFINHGTFDHLLQFSLRSDTNLEQLKALTISFCEVSIKFLQMCGQKPICDFYRRICLAFSSLKRKEEFFQLISAFTLYAGRYHSWAVFLFPWELGDYRLYGQKLTEGVGSLSALNLSPSHHEQAPEKEEIEIQQLNQALVQWRQVLGQDWVCTDSERLIRESLNTSEFSPRRLLACLSPENSDQVSRLVEIAAKYSVPLYPFSTGKNWGLGSRLPVKGPSALVDLSRMNRILEVNEEFQYAIIEPGVTQGQLSEYLIKAGSRCKLNVTGAGRRTSVVGNILERGAGYLGPRNNDLLELEVVLGNGQLLKTGSWHLLDKHSTTTPRHYYSSGLGADLTGLFVQSNFGVVTRMVVKLYPVHPITEVGIEVPEAALPDLIDEIRKLRDEGILHGNVRYTNGGDQVFQIFPDNRASTFLAQAMICGCQSMRIAGRGEVEKRLKPIANHVSFFDNELEEVESWQGEAGELLQKRQNLLYGIPFDQRIETIMQHSGKTIAECNYTLDQDRDLKGFLCVNVAIPFAGRYVLQVANVVQSTSQKYGFKPAILLATLGERSLSGFFPFYFDRNNREEIQRVHDLKHELHQELAEIGIYPMRSDVDSLRLLSDSAYDSFWETLGSIKSVLDPNHVIAPGRYCP